MADRFVQYWQQQQAKHRQQSRQASRQARSDLERISRALRDHYGAQQIILFGSLVSDRFTPNSDIDLAVAGLAAADFFTAYAEVNRLSRFKVDLKPLESLYPHFYQRILTQGEVIYEASDRA